MDIILIIIVIAIGLGLYKFVLSKGKGENSIKESVPPKKEVVPEITYGKIYFFFGS